MSENTVKHFEISKNFAFKVNSQDEENELNQLFTQLKIDPQISKKDQFFQFVDLFKKYMVNQPVKQLTKKLTELTEENETLRSEKIELTEEKSRLKTQLTTVKPELTELTGKIEILERELEAEKSKAPETIEKTVNQGLTANELLINLPPFHHFLLSRVAGSSAMQRFDASKPEKNGLYIKFKNLEDKKEIMSSTLLNFFVGIIMNYHRYLGHLPDINRIASLKDINEAIEYAKNKIT